MSEAQVLSMQVKELGDRPITKLEYQLMASTTVTVFEILERAWAAQGCTLVDMKVEYGVDTETGKSKIDVS